MTNRIADGHMDPLEVDAVHQAMPQGIIQHWVQTSEEVHLATDRPQTSNERSEKSKRVFKKPRCYKDESDGCIDTWIEVMKLHFEEEDLSERQ